MPKMKTPENTPRKHPSITTPWLTLIGGGWKERFVDEII
jgi:hypothetical protein